MARRWIQLVGAGATGQAGPAGAGGMGTAAPNIVTATAAAAYFLNGNVSSFGFAGRITLPTGNPDYAHLAQINVRAYKPGSTLAILLCVIPRASFGATYVDYSAGTFTQSQTGIEAWSVDFQVENENGAPTGSPLPITPVNVQQSKVNSVTASEVGARFAEPVNRQPHLTIGLVPVLNGNQVPQWVTYWISIDASAGTPHWRIIDAQRMDSVGQTLNVDRLVEAATSDWGVATAVGIVPGDATVLVTSLPTGAMTCTPFSVAGIGAPAAGTITNATLGAITVKQDFTSGWQWPELDIVNWTESATDPNSWLVELLVRETNVSGTPSGDDRGQWRPWSVNRQMVGGARDSTPQILQITYRDPAGAYAAYHYLQMQIVTVNRKAVNPGDWSDPTIGRVQQCWTSGGTPNTAYLIQADYGTINASTSSLPVNYNATTVSSPSTVTPDLSTGTVQGYTLGAAVTVNLPTNARVGQEFILEFIQDGTGGRVVTLNASYRGNTDLPFDLSPNAATQIRVMVRPGPVYTISGVFTTT
jgi:hypothetical protein